MQEDFLKILDLAIQKAGSVRKLSDALNCDPSSITRWKCAEKNGPKKASGRMPNLDSVQTILDFLGCNWCEALQLVRPSERSQGENTISLKQRIMELEAQVRALEVYKHKWEGHLEAEAVRAQGSNLSMPIEKKLSA